MGDKDTQQTLFEAVKKDDASASTPSHSDASPAPEPVPESAPVSPVSQPTLTPTRAPVVAPQQTAPPTSFVPSVSPSTPPIPLVPRRPLTREEQNKLFDQMNDTKRIVSELRNQLISLNDKKRAAFQKKDVVSQKIKSLIGEVKSARSERDKLTHLVKESKGRRKDLNDEARIKIEEIKKLNKEKQDLIRKHNLTTDPAQLKKEIDELDFKIETEAPSPAEEK